MRRFESCCLRKILRIRWQQHVTEEEVRRRSEQESVIQKIKIKRWTYFGRGLCTPDGRVPKDCLNPLSSDVSYMVHIIPTIASTPVAEVLIGDQRVAGNREDLGLGTPTEE